MWVASGPKSNGARCSIVGVYFALVLVQLASFPGLPWLQLWSLPVCFRLGNVLEVGLVSWLELVLFLQLLCSWRYKCEYATMSRTCDVTRATDHVVRFTRPSGSVFAYCKRSKTWAEESLGTRLGTAPTNLEVWNSSVANTAVSNVIHTNGCKALKRPYKSGNFKTTHSLSFLSSYYIE